MLKVLLAGGGTAGHLNPALAIAEIIKKNHPDAEFLFAGTPFGMEAKLIAKTNYKFAPIKVKGFQRKLSIKNIGRNIQAAAYLTTAGHRAKQIIKEFNPDIVIGTGGYVSGPVVLKAAEMKIPTVIHEQNAYPGVTTRLLSQKVNEVMLTVPEAMEYLDKNIKYTVTGLPVRSGIHTKTKSQARKELGIDDGMCILSFGGSLGAGMINETVSDLIKWHDGKLKINHIHGYGGMGKDTFIPSLKEKNVNLDNPRLNIREYIDNMDTCMAAADLVICRSGANTLSELETMGRASILIPSPIVAGNHQYHNAVVLENAGAAIVIEQKNLTSEILIKKVEELYNDRIKLEKLSCNASKLAITDTDERIYEVIEKLLNK
ncbi:MAG TPA: undecaprenyldiphospho-muramoylpentapeptide beta-N-acetylglucosaminyltransferase [Oscillospiraceae bacterium]|nr:undecaprenyldiphospho-muramoylpentapeptide beta-N-acetylglucosaminyltransferase [Oscillospiraceae bacterium]